VQELGSLLPFIVIAVVFWLLLIRPQRKRQAQLMATQRSVTVGDEVLLGAGIFGRVVGEADDSLELEIAPGVPMKVARGAVVRVLQPEATEPPPFGATDTTPASDPAEPTDPNDPTRGH
jgi:preprotein translocase subunit YajC